MQIQDLQRLVIGTSSSVGLSFSLKSVDLMTAGNRAKDETLVSIQNQQSKIEEEIAIIKTIAQESEVDISNCLIDYEYDIGLLKNETLTSLSDCINDKVKQSTSISLKFNPLVNQYKLRVTNISSQIELCKNDNCLIPLMNFITIQENALITKIYLERTRGYNLYDISKLGIENCQENNIAQFSFLTTMLVNDIRKCSNLL